MSVDGNSEGGEKGKISDTSGSTRPTDAPAGENLQDLMTQLSQQIIEEHLRNLKSHSELQHLVLRGAMPKHAVDKAYLDYVREEGERQGQRITEAAARYYAELMGMCNDWSRRFYERILADVSASPSDNGGKQDQ